MAKQKGKADGETLFGAYYQNIYQDRWEPLKAALIKDKVPIAYNEGLTNHITSTKHRFLLQNCLVCRRERLYWTCVQPQEEKRLFLLPVSRVRGNWSPMTVLPPAEQD
nr:hypothetical protein [uncultured Sphaerochaeta sp.]